MSGIRIGLFHEFNSSTADPDYVEQTRSKNPMKFAFMISVSGSRFNRYFFNIILAANPPRSAISNERTLSFPTCRVLLSKLRGVFPSVISRQSYVPSPRNVKGTEIVFTLTSPFNPATYQFCPLRLARMDNSPGLPFIYFISSQTTGTVFKKSIT